jgi:VWFA-related protein
MTNRAGVVAAALGIALVVQGTSGQEAQQPPNFRSGVELVTLDFLAFDAGGRPITDLAANEITLKVNGRSRDIRSMHWIQIAAPVIEGVEPPVLIPPPFGSNIRSDAGRAIIIALDDESLRTGREAPLRRAVNRFLGALAPRDRVALVTMPYGGVKVDFTNEHDKVAQSLSMISGQTTRTEDGSEAACRTRRTLEALRGLLDGLGLPESPTTVMFFTTSLSGPRRDAPVSLAPGRCELKAELFQQVGIAASNARAQFYLIQPEDPALVLGSVQTENIAGAGFKGSDNPFEGIEHLGGVTGARRLHLSTAGDDTLLRILNETTGYYLAAFAPDAGDRNGLRHRIEFGVKRDAAAIRARPELLIERADPRKPASTPQAMLRAPKVFRDLPLRAAGYVSRESDGKVKVIVMAEPIEPGVEIRSAASAIFDQNGRLTAQSTADDSALSATPVITGLVAPVGAYRLRVAATDATGRTGTADFDLAAELAPAGPLAVSSVMLGLSRGGGFSPRLVFGTEPVALAYMEIYGDTNGAPVSLKLEIATTPNGPAALSIPGAVADTRATDRRIATAAIPIGGLPPGDYIVRAVVSMEGEQAGRVSRTIRKIGR